MTLSLDCRDGQHAPACQSCACTCHRSPVERLRAAIERLEALKQGEGNEDWYRLHSFSGLAVANGREIVLNATYGDSAELAVTLHKTIDAQIAILRSGVELLEEHPDFIQRRLIPAALTALADAILGGTE